MWLDSAASHIQEVGEVWASRLEMWPWDKGPHGKKRAQSKEQPVREFLHKERCLRGRQGCWGQSQWKRRVLSLRSRPGRRRSKSHLMSCLEKGVKGNSPALSSWLLLEPSEHLWLQRWAPDTDSPGDWENRSLLFPSHHFHFISFLFPLSPPAWPLSLYCSSPLACFCNPSSFQNLNPSVCRSSWVCFLCPHIRSTTPGSLLCGSLHSQSFRHRSSQHQCSWIGKRSLSLC